MARQQDLKGQWALVTSASSGFGVDFAHLLAERGANLVLAARSAGPMEALAALLRATHGVRTHVVAIELARGGVGVELKDRLDKEGIDVEILVNNAGYGVFGPFMEQPLARTLDMMQLNMASLTELTHAFESPMAARGSGKILLVASIGAIQATPTYAAYSATKAFVLLFGEALHEELKGRGVTVTVLSPGITATGFLAVPGQRATLYQRMVMMQSRPVARIGLQALYSGRTSIVPGWLNALTAWSNRLMPRMVQRKVATALMKN
ncbi:SDR family NAD(P)-dependent oxidoreductase [Massilia glaciei]|uniref:SDR family NAD(P)-dependent oxidoreductase n=1 Tax=Massilia glaciei TaxID=1524097 RepID=A0A2U2HGI0_9BURK|nr:SDR family oxidoreductase [Massilia glaciei]PWF43992.1 SDR family NAD(P)-dependent oxidoreductase [Massilia glaciei]